MSDISQESYLSKNQYAGGSPWVRMYLMREINSRCFGLRPLRLQSWQNWQSAGHQLFLPSSILPRSRLPTTSFSMHWKYFTNTISTKSSKTKNTSISFTKVSEAVVTLSYIRKATSFSSQLHTHKRDTQFQHDYQHEEKKSRKTFNKMQ